MRKMSEILDWERQHCANGILPDASTPEAAAYLARVVDSDARRAEALALAHPNMDSLQKIRSFLKRGSLQEAEKVLLQFETTSQSAEILAELFLEQARLSLF